MNIYGLNVNTQEVFEKNEKDVEFLDFVYLHGDLEKKNGYDLVSATEETYHAITACYFGKFDVDVILHNGEKEHGLLFYWHDNESRRHGLIVSGTDTESMVYAQEKFYSRANTI